MQVVTQAFEARDDDTLREAVEELVNLPRCEAKFLRPFLVSAFMTLLSLHYVTYAYLHFFLLVKIMLNFLSTDPLVKSLCSNRI